MGEWDTIFLTGQNFRERVGDQPLFGQIIEAAVDFGKVETYKNQVSSILWGLKRRKLQYKLFSIVDEMLDRNSIDAVLVLDGDGRIIHDCWQRNLRKHPSVAWVTGHSTLDFWFTRISVRSIFKWRIGVLVKRMIEGMGATIFYADHRLLDDFFRKLNIPNNYRERIILTDFGCDPEDLRLPKEKARQKLGIPQDAKVALFFGLLRADKRPDVTIDAVAEAGIPWWILMAGKPYSYSQRELQALIENSNLRYRSTLLLYYLTESEVKLVFSAADVLMVTHERAILSSSGIIGLARSYRLPMVISSLSYLGRKIEREGTGLVCPKGDPGSFTSALHAFSAMKSDDIDRLISIIEKSAYKHSFLATARNYSKALNTSLVNTQQLA